MFAFSFGRASAANTADHIAIKKDVTTIQTSGSLEAARSKATDAATVKDIAAIKTDVRVIQTTLAAQYKTLDKLEKKIP